MRFTPNSVLSSNAMRRAFYFQFPTVVLTWSTAVVCSVHTGKFRVRSGDGSPLAKLRCLLLRWNACILANQQRQFKSQKVLDLNILRLHGFYGKMFNELVVKFARLLILYTSLQSHKKNPVMWLVHTVYK
jgi:hypothetical protein